MDPTAWERDHWANGLAKGTRWDLAGPSPTLLYALTKKQYVLGADCKALVPGCGRAYDALALAQQGFSEVVAVDIAPSAVKAAQEELAEHSQEPAASKVKVFEADFFKHEGKYDLIWDCTFLCALPPALREQWASSMSTLLKPGGRLIQCVFPIAPEKDPSVGPPFPLTIELCKSLLEPAGLEAVEVVELLADNNSHKAQSENKVVAGRTGFIEWKLAGSS
mmetsp:Transcript_34358/g.78291  ORF Transcript_34358/g.78291 Transcript_34358/m.78291 type:complete len:221 (-) Transcript_34358:130-792(-)